MMSLPLSIVIPAFNEADNIEAVVQEAHAVLSQMTTLFDVVVVDDASGDKTPSVLHQLQQEIPQLTVIRNANNIGCHPSTLVGFKAAKGLYRLFIPGDGQIPAAELAKFVEQAQAGCDVVYSWRIQRADPPHRLWVSGFYNWVVRHTFRIGVHDIDSASMLSQRAVDQILPHLQSHSAFITVEILLEAKRQGLAIGEVIIDHRPRTAGVARGLNFKDVSRVPWAFLKMVGWVLQQKLRRG